MVSHDIKGNVSLPLKVGQFFSRTICFDAASIRQFAILVGDPNPLHHDIEAAKKTRFGGLIASGTHISSILGATVAAKLCSLCPSLGLEVSFRFRKPVHADLHLIARWEIISIESSNRLNGDIVTFSVELRSSHEVILVTGLIVSLVTYKKL